VSPPQAASPPKLWTIVDLAEWMGVTNDDAWEAVRSQGVPFVFYGKGSPDLTKKGGRKVRFIPAAVVKWAESNQVRWGPPAESRGEADAPESPVSVEGEGGWRTELGGEPRRKKPSR